MSEFLLHYHKVHPTTWVYLSSLLIIGLFFKFNRVWSVRNLDLGLLILLAPGLLLVHFGAERQTEALHEWRFEQAQAAAEPPPADPDVGAAAEPEPSPAELKYAAARSIVLRGYLMLLFVSALWLTRLLLDPAMVRRPLLEPNLSTGGLTFICCASFVFLMANVINSQPTRDDLQGPRRAEAMIERRTVDPQDDSLRRYGPGYAWLNLLPSLPTMTFYDIERSSAPEEKTSAYAVTAKTMAILSHLAVVMGIVMIGYRHFDNLRMGIGAATLYLIMPYTAQMTGRVEHVLPAALLVWAVLCYRRPLTAGIFLGLSMATVYYPFFLLPLWISFYWQRGLMRFVLGVAAMLVLMVVPLAFTSDSLEVFFSQVRQMFGLWVPALEGLEGVWGLAWDPIYRWPVLAAFVALSISFAIWPPRKNLGTLMSCSGALMVATQFWHGYGGGLYIAWYLPLALLTVFRPNLEDRIALAVLGEGWLPRRRQIDTPRERAA